MEDKKVSVGGITYSDNEKGNKMHSAKDGKFTGKGEAAEEKTEAPERRKTKLEEMFAAFMAKSPEPKKKITKLEAMFYEAYPDSKVEKKDFFETIEEIKENERNILTLKNFSAHSKRGREIKQASRDARITPEQLQEINEAWDRCYENSTPCTNIEFDKLYNFFYGSKHMYNLFEARENGFSGNGYVGSGRINATRELFGTTLDNGNYIPTSWWSELRDGRGINDHKKILFSLEKYGFLGDKTPYTDDSGGADQYGECTIKYKKSTMETRSTYTIGDSLNADAIPQYIALGFSSAALVGSEKIVKVDYDRLRAAKSMNDFKRCFGWTSYIECQMHGDVTVDDVESIVLPPSSYAWSERRKVQLAKILKITEEKGISVYEEFAGKPYRVYLDSDGIIQFEEYKGE